jgi:glyoxalase family protein
VKAKMEKAINGIHHITVMSSDPQANYDFYTQTLGMRFIKKTVNFDAPDVYHLYYADEVGTPGTVLTFFLFPDSRRGKRGTGEITVISFSVPSNSLQYWMERFANLRIDFDSPKKKYGYEFLSLLDPDGMKIEIVADPNVDSILGWYNGDVSPEHSIRKFFGSTFYLNDSKATEELLSGVMGAKLIPSERKIKRYALGERDSLSLVDIIEDENAPRAVGGAGTVHHIAWRTASDEEQLNWREKILEHGFYPTKIIDRNYFHSIYFREPGGILFEIATDQPGFMIDESFENLGTDLKLPAWHEPKRKLIEQILVPLKTRTFIKQN